MRVRLTGFFFFLCAIVLLSSCAPIPTATPTSAPTDTEPVTLLTIATNTPPSATATFTPLPPSQPATLTPRTGPSATPTRRTGLSNSPKTDFLPPVVQALPPPSGSAVSQFQVVPVTILAADDTGVARVEVFDNDNLYSIMNAPVPEPKNYSTIVNWSSAQLGSHIVSVVAYDTQENASANVELPFVVVNDNRRPFTLITYPLGAQQIELDTPLMLEGIASDDVAITRVELVADGDVYTFRAPDDRRNTNASTPFVVSFTWIPRTTGNHTLFLRAYDNQNQSTDSSPLSVLVNDVHAPALATFFDRDSLATGEPVVISALAVSQAGIARVELLADDTLIQSVPSNNVAAQTSLYTQMVWSSEFVGDHFLQLRAVDQFGLIATSLVRVVHVRDPKEATPLPTAIPTPTATRTPIPTRAPGTPTLAPPQPPTVILSAPKDKATAIAGSPVRVTIDARGDSELEHMELWATYLSQPDAVLLTSQSARGNTSKTLNFDWTPPAAGIVAFYARVFDIYGQTVQTSVVTLYVNSASSAKPTPAFTNLAGRWQAELPTGTFTLELIQIANALRGAFAEERTDGQIPGSGSLTNAGFITSGAISNNQVNLAIDFQTSPTRFFLDCTLGPDSTSLVCLYADTQGRSGNAVFQKANGN